MSNIITGDKVYVVSGNKSGSSGVVSNAAVVNGKVSVQLNQKNGYNFSAARIKPSNLRVVYNVSKNQRRNRRGNRKTRKNRRGNRKTRKNRR
jgi:ribosomal protein L24